MKSRKVSNIEKALLKKGFIKNKGKDHHSHYYLYIDGKKSHIYTYLSHGSKSSDYDKYLMNKIKNQLKFNDSNKAELFFDCPMSGEQYLEMLESQNEI